MRFVDEALVNVRSGRGGNGLVSFRREKFVPRGGPDGGDGGRGGDVVVRADPGLKTLLDFRYRRKYAAGDGASGGKNRRTGRSGADLVLRVPVGTLVMTEAGEALADLDAPDAELMVARGGRPGAGNARLALPWRQAPDFARKGGEAETVDLRFELKLLADVGLVGLPNAGKSTLINRVSKARARVADYPFTTLVPNLGMVSLGLNASFVVADLPGLIAGAAGGAGLGLQFLRHCERTKVLVHLVDVASGADPVQSFRTVERELAAHGAGLEGKPLIVVANKVDMPGTEAACEALRGLAARRGLPFHAISALTGAGVADIVREMARRVFAGRD